MISRFLVNCGHGAPLPSGADHAAAPSIEAMANTTPLVLDSVFFPFGKEPRQFDTFYVGSKEAFSKKGADVTLAFDMADTTFTALTAVREGAFDNVLAGVAQDGALYVLELNASTGVVSKFRDRGSLRPPRADRNADAPLACHSIVGRRGACQFGTTRLILPASSLRPARAMRCGCGAKAQRARMRVPGVRSAPDRRRRRSPVP